MYTSMDEKNFVSETILVEFAEAPEKCIEYFIKCCRDYGLKVTVEKCLDHNIISVRAPFNMLAEEVSI